MVNAIFYEKENDPPLHPYSMRFDNIGGYERLKQQLRKTAEEKRLPHALLLCGPDGSGALALALALAQYVNCLSPKDGEPCGHCPSCAKYNILAHPDLFFLFPIVGGDKTSTEDFLPLWREYASQPYLSSTDWLQAIKAGNSRPLIYSKESESLDRQLSYQIAEAQYRVLIIWQPERMHETLSNKLLKFIEEPPKHTLILLVSIEPQLLLPTILSRTQRIELPIQSESEIYDLLSKDPHIGASDAERRQAAHLSEGSMRKALAYLTGDKERDEDFALFLRMLSLFNPANPLGMRHLADDLAGRSREEQSELLTAFASYFRELYVYPLNLKQISYLTSQELRLADRMKGVISSRNVRSISSELDLALLHIQRNVNSRMVFFDLFLRLASLLSGPMKNLGATIGTSI